ncbi:hypothetical protein BDV06DRAFT_231622 [Aspergillus oleicola]
MFFLIPIAFVLAGVGLLFAHRRYKGLKGKEQSKPIVEGHTYSESIKEKTLQEVKETKVENVRRCCFVGAGRVGALTAITLAKHNPEIHFSVVDSKKGLIKAWNCDALPIAEPGLEEIFFDDTSLEARSEEATLPEESTINALVCGSGRRRTLQNLVFSANIHAAVASADLIFLCVEMENSQSTNGESLDHSYLNPTLRLIANNSTRHKIIVQRTAAPYGVTQYITNYVRDISLLPEQSAQVLTRTMQLKSTASPTASFTVLTNPSFTLPGTSMNEMLNSQRVIIGHIYSPETSVLSITALKRLYASWIPEESIVTMDAWSVELGRIASKTLLAQQLASIESIRMLCQNSEASASNVGWMLGIPNLGEGPAMRCGALQNEVHFLVDILTQSGSGSIAGYWGEVLRVDGIQQRRAIDEMVKSLPKATDNRKVAVLGNSEDPAMTSVLLKRLRDSGALVQVRDGLLSKTQAQRTLRNEEDNAGAKVMAGSLEEAFSGCCAVVFQGDCQVGDDVWQKVASTMEEPRLLLSMGSGVDQVKMKQLGFRLIGQ